MGGVASEGKDDRPRGHCCNVLSHSKREHLILKTKDVTIKYGSLDKRNDEQRSGIQCRVLIDQRFSGHDEKCESTPQLIRLDIL